MEKPYTYKDFKTGKEHYTHGEFVGWSEPTGPAVIRYAIFRTPKTYLNVPIYCLTKDTIARLLEEQN